MGATVFGAGRQSRSVDLADTLAGQLHQLAARGSSAGRRPPAPVRELQWHPVRLWRLDLAWPDLQLAVEVDGGTWVRGRHSRADGIRNDCEKLNALALAGWTVLRYTTESITDWSAAGEVDVVVRQRMALSE